MESDLCIVQKNQPPKPEQQQPTPPPGVFVDTGVLPDDLVVEILSRLPVRRLLCLRCVSKSWCALIDDINFIKKHYGFHYCVCKQDGDVPLLYWEPKPDPLRGLNYDLNANLLSKRNGDVPVDMTADLVRDSCPWFSDAPEIFKDGRLVRGSSPWYADALEFFKEGQLVGAVNGIVCYVWGYTKHDLGLWNPATREFKAITPWLLHPPLSHCFTLIGFGFDCVSNDFKIVRVISVDETLSHEVYSLTSNTWKTVKEQTPFVCPYRGAFPGAYLNGVCYWCASSVISESALLLSFNFNTEVFEFFDQPQCADASEFDDYEWSLTLYKERLAFVFNHTDVRNGVHKFNVWVVSEFDDNSGIPVSWQHLFAFGPFPLCEYLLLYTFRMDGDALFLIKYLGTDEETSLYNPSTAHLKIWDFFLQGFAVM